MKKRYMGLSYDEISFDEQTIENGKIGDFAGWKINGKTYDPEGNEIVGDIHDEDCFCCRKVLLKPVLEEPKS